MHGNLDYVDPMDWRQFLIVVNKLADNFNYGTDKSPFLGSGVEFVQLESNSGVESTNSSNSTNGSFETERSGRFAFVFMGVCACLSLCVCCINFVFLINSLARVK